MPGSWVRVPPLLSPSQVLGLSSSSAFSFPALPSAPTATPFFLVQCCGNALPAVTLLAGWHEPAVDPRHHDHVLKRRSNHRSREDKRQRSGAAPDQAVCFYGIVPSSPCRVRPSSPGPEAYSVSPSTKPPQRLLHRRCPRRSPGNWAGATGRRPDLPRPVRADPSGDAVAVASPTGSYGRRTSGAARSHRRTDRRTPSRRSG